LNNQCWQRTEIRRAILLAGHDLAIDDSALAWRGERRVANGFRFLPNKYDPPSFAHRHNDMRLATELGRELAVPSGLPTWHSPMTEALNHGKTATADHPRCSSSNAVGSGSKLILGAFKRC